MDAKQCGIFIAERRKELGLTQARLAEQLSVTDKAVSRWERGVGLPDINNIEALAAALDVSIVELLQAKRNPADNLSTKEAENLLIDTIQLSKAPRRFTKTVGYIVLTLFAMLAVMVLCVLISDWEIVRFPAGSIIAGLLAWGIPIWQITIAKTSRTMPAAIASFGF